MRLARKKIVGDSCYYHLYNRVSGPVDALPFGDVEKEFAYKLIVEIGRFFLVETISAAIMGNHFHIVAYAPAEKPSLKDAALRYNAYHGITRMDMPQGGRILLDPEINPVKCQQVAEQMVDVSSFMKVFQQRFTIWYNRIHKSRGTLWGDRFKSTILEGSRESLWSCVKYVEMNAVRAGIVEEPENYRFCSWGRLHGSGSHSFHKSFIKHMRTVAEKHSGQKLSVEEVIAEFRGELARIKAWENGKDTEEIARIEQNARKVKESMPVRFMRRTRHWTDGAIIGSKQFVLNVGCQFEKNKRIMKKQLSRGTVPDGKIYCFRKLVQNLE